MAKLKITLKKSKIGRIEKHIKNVEASFILGHKNDTV